MYDDEKPLPYKREPVWRAILFWRIWPLTWRGPLWFWLEEHTRARKR